MKDIYVNKEGVICACTVPFPNEKDFSGDQWKENAALQACKNSAVPFEEQKDAKEILLPKHLFPTVPDTFYQIEADWEIVEIDTVEDGGGCFVAGTKEVARLKVPAPTVATDNSGEKSYADVFKKLGAYIVSEVAITKNQLEIFKESKNRDMVSRCDSAIRIYEKLSEFLAKELPRKS